LKENNSEAARYLHIWSREVKQGQQYAIQRRTGSTVGQGKPVALIRALL